MWCSGDKYIPIIQHGSYNCFEVSWQGREIAEKNWGVLNYPKYNQFIFAEDEIIDLAKEQEEFEKFKSRYKQFGKGEYSRWFINGMRNAKTLDYYLQLGNTLRIIEYKEYPKSEFYYPKTEEELLCMINDFAKQDKSFNIGFVERKLRRPKQKKNKREKKLYPYFFTLSNNERYLVKVLKWGYRYSLSRT